MKQVNEQMSFLPVLAVDASINRVFSVVEKKNESDELVGQTLKARSRKELAAALGLSIKTDKDRITEIALQGSDDLKTQLVAIANRVGGNSRFTGAMAQLRETKNGELTLALKFRTVNRNGALADDRLCELVYPTVQFPDMSHEEKLAKLAALREKQLADVKETVEL